MANVIIPQRFWTRRGTAAALTAANETLYAGEWCLETDTGKAKYGDGVSDWATLDYSVPGRYDLTGLADGAALAWDATAQRWVPIAVVAEAPVDATLYGRKDGAWEAVPAAAGAVGAIGATFDGGGAALTPGVFVDVPVPFDCTIDSATVLADQTGSIVFFVLADPYSSFPPTTDIAPTTPPAIISGNKSQDAALSGWTTTISAGTVVRFGIVSCASIQRATLTLEVTKT